MHTENMLYNMDLASKYAENKNLLRVIIIFLIANVKTP